MERDNVLSGQGMFKLTAVVEKEDDFFVAHCIELGVVSQGKTVEKALANLKEATELYVKHAEPEELAFCQNNTL